MITIEYLIYHDEPMLCPVTGKYIGVAPAYGSIAHYEYDTAATSTNLADALPSECVWIVPGTIQL